MAKHPNLSDDINNKIEQSEKDGGIWLKNLRAGDELLIQTQNTSYSLKKIGEDDYEIQGHAKYCPKPTPCKVSGSTWGGSMLKMKYVGRNMHLEFYTKEHGRITTSQIKQLIANRVH